MTEALERQGVRAAPGNQHCPECGSDDGLSVNFRKNIASCFACGKKYFPTKEYDESWLLKFYTQFYKRCRKELDDPETALTARAYLSQRGLEPADYRCEPIGVIPVKMDSKKWAGRAKELHDEEAAKIEKKIAELDRRNIKDRLPLQERLDTNLATFTELEAEILSLSGALGWLAFFYTDEKGDFVSVNIRNPNGDGYKSIKPTRRKGMFSPTAGDYPNALPGSVMLVEGEFNLLTLRKAYRQTDPNFFLSSVALGSAASWDYRAVRAYFEDATFCVNYDNDIPGAEAVKNLANTGSLWAFAVPLGENSHQNDADYFIKKHSLLEYAREWSQAKKIYRSWESCKAALDEIANAEDMSERERSHAGLETVRRLLLERGVIYNCGNVATYIDNETHEMIQVERGGLAFSVLLHRLGIYAGDKFLAPDVVGKDLGAFAQTCPKNTVYLMSYYNEEKHVLYVNEYGGNFLKIDGAGNVERLLNGEEGMLFSVGTGTCEPLVAALDAMPMSLMTSPLDSGQGMTLIKEKILDRIIYSTEGIGRDNAHLILMTAIIGLFFPERIPSMPIVYLYGPGASMKTSAGVAVGKLVQGKKFKATPATDDIQEMKDMAISVPFIVLDEANNIKKLTDVLKTIATGAVDSRRELYTTATQRITPYQARIWMTANTASLTNETISSRMMIIDAAARTEANPYRSEFYLNWTDAERNEIWTELILRLAATMRNLKDASDTGDADFYVSHRMSSFFVFGMTLAIQNDREEEFLGAMQAMESRQQGASLEGNDIVDLVEMLPASYSDKMRSAKEWSGILTQLVSQHNVELQRNVSRTGWVAYQFKNNHHALTLRFGMVTGTVAKNVHGYRFTKLTGVNPEQQANELADVV
jgi:hypothetical protein